MFKNILVLLIINSYVLEATNENIQWASSVLGFSSEYQSQEGQAYRATQILGNPNSINSTSNTPCAWSPSRKNRAEIEWIKVGFSRPQNVAQVLINQTNHPGAIAKVILHATDGKSDLYFETLNASEAALTNRLFRIVAPRTTYKVTALTLQLQTDWVDGWNNIDAIGISETADLKALKPNLVPQLPLLYVIHLNEHINSPYNELFPMISPDGKTLYFDRNNHPENTFSVFPTNDDIWRSQSKNGAWQAAQHLGQPLNNQYANYVCGVSLDGNTLFLGHNYGNKEQRGGLGWSVKTQKTWSQPQKLTIKNFSNANNSVEFYVSADENILLSAVKAPDTYGQRDIYVSFKADRIWSEPKNLGAVINTAANELTPYLSFDTYTLYFASFGHAGYGSSDIFMSRRLDETWMNWSPPQNLGPDINTFEWEASFSIDAKASYAYFAAYRSHLEQGIDLFSVKLPAVLKPQAVMIVQGKIINTKTKKPLAAQVKYTSLTTKVAHSIDSDQAGSYLIALRRGQTYKIEAQQDNYLTLAETIDLTTSKTDELEQNLYLIPIDKANNDQIELDNVMFHFNSDRVLESSLPVLEKLVRLLQQNSNLKIIVEGHTDFGGDPANNFQLSKLRVLAVQDYLIKAGISIKRLTLKPLGSAKPLTRKRDEKSKQLNRRVEFKLVQE